MSLNDELFFNLCLSVSSGFCSIPLFYMLQVAFTLRLKYMLLGSKQSTVHLRSLFFYFETSASQKCGWENNFLERMRFCQKMLLFCEKIQLTLLFCSFFSGKVYEESKLSFNLHFLFFINFKFKPCLLTYKFHVKYFVQNFSTHFI